MWWIIISALICYAHGAEPQEKLQIVTPRQDASASRIMGGSPIIIEYYPFTVQILLNNVYFCAGAILTNRHIMSAAHCFFDVNGVQISPTPVSIRAGSTYLNTGGTVHRAALIINHELFNRETRDNDISVVLLGTALRFGNTIQQAPVPNQGYVLPDNVTVTHMGWGSTNPNVNTMSNVLNMVQVRSVNRAVCSYRYSFISAPITNNMVCSGLLDVGNADACHGDDGGPLVYSNAVVGVTSFGYGCGTPYYPRVNTRVASYTNWINATITRYNSGSAKEVSAMLILVSFVSTMLFFCKI